MSPKTCPTPRIPQDQRNPREIESRLATGEIRRVRRSTYIPASPDALDFTTHRTIREVLLRVVRTERLDGVVALETAALLHGGRALYEPAAVHLIVGWNAAGLDALLGGVRPIGRPRARSGRATAVGRWGPAHSSGIATSWPAPTSSSSMGCA